MKVIETDIPEVLIFEPNVFGDDRGFFFESFNQAEFERVIGRSVNFVQDNHSCSSVGVLRGLHYQLPPSAQAKLIRCVAGALYDIAVDIRENSPNFGQWVGAKLSAKNKKQIWIPEGFAHGFIALEEGTEILYKTNNYYSKNDERAIRWDDEQLAIEWPIKPTIVSDKDKQAYSFGDAQLFRK